MVARHNLKWAKISIISLGALRYKICIVVVSLFQNLRYRKWLISLTNSTHPLPRSFIWKNLKYFSFFFYLDLGRNSEWINGVSGHIRAHIEAKLGQENLLKMVRWQCPPDTWFEIRVVAAWERYLSLKEAPYNDEFLRVNGEETFYFFETWQIRDLRLSKQAALTTAPRIHTFDSMYFITETTYNTNT